MLIVSPKPIKPTAITTPIATDRVGPVDNRPKKLWHMTPEIWHLTYDMWHVTHGGGWTFSQNSSSPGLKLSVSSSVKCHLLSVSCYLTTTRCSFTCNESPRRVGDAAAGGLALHRERKIIYRKISIHWSVLSWLIKRIPSLTGRFHLSWLRRHREGTNKQTNKQTGITTYRLNPPSGRFSENCFFHLPHN